MLNIEKSDLMTENSDELDTPLSLSCVAENHRTAAWHLREAMTFHELAATAFETENLKDMTQHKNSAKLHHLLAIQYTKMAERIASHLDC
jgi:ATP-dependent helicase/DNAse subunit B